MCIKASPGCSHCYAETMNVRFGNGLSYHHKAADVSTPFVRTEEFEKPFYKWHKPRSIFVCSMTDIMLPVWRPFIYQIFAVMIGCTRHRWQILTKHPKPLLETVDAIITNPKLVTDEITRLRQNYLAKRGYECSILRPVPQINFDHCLFGASAENQDWYEKRLEPIQKLAALGLRTWWSLEPLLGKINLGLSEIKYKPDWIVFGGESGRNARYTGYESFTSVRDQALEHGIPLFFKQWGKYSPGVVGERNPVIVMADRGKVEATFFGVEYKQHPEL